MVLSGSAGVGVFVRKDERPRIGSTPGRAAGKQSGPQPSADHMPNGEPGHSGRAGRARGIGLRVWQEYNVLYLESVVPSVIPEKPRRIVQHLAFLLQRLHGMPCRFANGINLAQLVERHTVQCTYG